MQHAAHLHINLMSACEVAGPGVHAAQAAQLDPTAAPSALDTSASGNQQLARYTQHSFQPFMLLASIASHSQMALSSIKSCLLQSAASSCPADPHADAQMLTDHAAARHAPARHGTSSNLAVPEAAPCTAGQPRRRRAKQSRRPARYAALQLHLTVLLLAHGQIKHPSCTADGHWLQQRTELLSPCSLQLLSGETCSRCLADLASSAERKLA